MKDHLRHLISKSLVTLIAFFGIPWAVHPFLSPPQGIYDYGWTHAQLIRDRYPMHLVDPAWLSDDTLWEIPETEVRLAGVLVTIVSVFVIAEASGKKKPKALAEKPS